MSDIPVGATVRVRVPATSANLGPAFDAAGLALGLVDDVEVEVLAEPAGSGRFSFDVEGEGAADVVRDDTHLVARTMLATWARHDVAAPAAVVIRSVNRIPHARGLGSSAAAIVAGVLAASALSPGWPHGFPMSGTLDLVCELEGHPDNVAAALLGGLTLAWTVGPDRVLAGTGHGDALLVSGSDVAALRLTPVAEVRPVVLIPPGSASTTAARGRLPATVPHPDAATAAGRGALLVAALTAAPAALLPATHDVLHQPYRAPMMAATADVVARLRGAGLAAVVSGAGPTVLVLCSDDDQVAAAVGAAPSDWTATPLPVAGPASVARVR